MKVKQLLKNILISIEDIKNLKKLTSDNDIALEDIFDKYQDVTSIIMFIFS